MAVASMRPNRTAGSPSRRWVLSRTKVLLPLALLIGCGTEGSVREPWGVPITGGTITASRDGQHAVIADPDRDRIFSLDLSGRAVTGELELDPGAQPGRVLEDGIGRIHVALRGSGSVITLASAAAFEVRETRYACAEPRGLAYDAARDAIHVACAGGELVTFPAGGGAAIRSLRLDRDLRDVVVSGDQLLVTRFRSAEILTLDAAGSIIARALPPTVQRTIGFGGPIAPGDAPLVDSTPTVAWRTIALPDGRIVMSHQRHTQRALDTRRPGGYGGGCNKGPVEDAISMIVPGSAPQTVAQIANGALPVDIAVSAAGDLLAVVAAGNRNVAVVPAAALAQPDRDECKPPMPDDDDKPGGDDGEDDDDDDNLGR